MKLIRNTALALASFVFLALPSGAQLSSHLTRAFVDTLETENPLPTLGRLGGVSVDADGTIFVSNFGTALWKVTPGGAVTLLNNNFILASGNSIAPDGRLIQCDFFRNRVYAVDKNSGTRTLLVRNGLNGPVGVAVDDTGAVFIANCNGQNVKRAAPGSLTANVYASGPLFSCPNGILFGPTGELFVSNFFTDDLLRIDGAGLVSVHAVVGTSGLGGGHLARIGNTLYATRFHSHDLYRISMSGTVERLAGQELNPGLRDGPGAYARLRHPNGIAAAPHGRVLYTNNLMGPQGTGMPGEVKIRRILVP